MINEKNKTLTNQKISNLKNIFSLIYFSEFKPNKVELNRINRNQITFLNYISSKETNFFQITNSYYNFSTLKNIKEQFIDNTRQMIILKDEEICLISCKNIYFFEPNSLQLDRKFENISFNSLNYITQINDGRLIIGTNNSEISVWEIERTNWIEINKKNEINIIGEIFKIILLNNNYFAVNSSNQSIFIIKEKDLNCFEIDYVFLNDDYYDFNHEKFLY